MRMMRDARSKMQDGGILAEAQRRELEMQDSGCRIQDAGEDYCGEMAEDLPRRTYF
jgi:hypothetical protein